MGRGIFLDIFCKFSLQKKIGFTLAEALIITVMTAFCLLPILGTMQNAQIRTQKYDHKSKMHLIARSRLNSEIAKAAFDHKSIDLIDQYNYIVYFDRGEEQIGCENNAELIELPRTTIKLEDLLSINNDNISTWNDKTIDLLGIDPLSCKPYLKVVHAYKTSIEIKDKLKFSNSISSIASETNYHIVGSNIDRLTDILNKTKVNHNKRFFGYIRPEYNISRLQSLASEDVRYFYNHDFLYGRLENSRTFIEPVEKTLINLSSYTTALLQIDQTSDLGGMFLGTFIASPSATENLSNYATDLEEKTFDGNNEKNHYLPKSSFVGWDSLKSEQTYILKNIPSFINSFEVSSSDNVKIDINSSSMLFSKDKANPILYLVDNSHLFAYYKNAVIRLNLNDSIITNPVISGDGQKLIFGISETNSDEEVENYLKVLNISSPTIDLFNNGALIQPVDKESYLGEITKIYTETTPSFLVTKPLNSISSSKIGGEFKILDPEYSVYSNINVSNNSIAIASGGIYLYADNKDVYLFDPLNNSIQKKDSLIVESYFPAVAVYNDILYFFGNFTQNNSLNPKSGRVQSYDVNSQKTMKSETKANDEYWANICTFDDTNWDSAVSLETSSNGTNSKPKYAFDGDFYKGWRGSLTGSGSNVYIKSIMKNLSLYFISNKICINNKFPDDNDRGVKEYKLYGIKNDNTEIHLTNGKVEKNSTNYSVVFDNNYQFKGYKFELLSNHANNKRRGIAELKFYRDRLKKLTPKINVIYSDNINFYWIADDDRIYKIKTSEPTEAKYKLADIYIQNYFFGYYNNPSFSGVPEAWSCNKSKPFIMLSMTEEEVLKVVRYCNVFNDKNYLKKFKIFGSNGDEVTPDPGDTGSNWEIIKDINNNSEFKDNPEICKTWITREVNNEKAYKHYLFWITEYDDNALNLAGFELYADNKMKDDYLTPLLSDNLEKTKAGEMAACSTPYGIAVSGGKLDVGGPNMSSDKTFLYWPHAINRYDGEYKQYGISRSLPNLNHKRFRHSMIWHKGRIYVIGGCPSGEGNYESHAADKFIEYLDYNKSLNWLSFDENDYVFINGAKKSDLKRSNHGVCSIGDEIFIFGGEIKQDESPQLISNIAINPETKVVRKLTNLPHKLTSCDAVVYGSKIYIIGMNTERNLTFYEYTP